MVAQISGWKISPGQMLPVQISLQQLLAAIEDPRNHGLDFGQNQFRKGWDIAELEFEWVVVAGVCEDILTQNIRKWCYVELVFWQKINTGRYLKTEN